MKARIVLSLLLTLAFGLPVVTILKAAQTPKTPSRPEGPGDIYKAAGCPPVAAHSTTRALYASYNGPLYQVVRQSDGKTLDIGVVQPSGGDAGGYADAAAQDAFCNGTTCWITTLYDQSGKGNHLVQAPPGTFKGPAKGGFNTLPIADMAPITISGRKAYGVYIMPGMGFRNNDARDVAINDEPEGIYYVINGKHFDSGCCFDYGNSSTNGRAVGTGTMETTYYGTATAWGSGSGPGPWIMSDMEAGLFSGYNAKQNPAAPTIDSWRFVTAVVDGGGGNKWDLRGGNAQKGGLTTYYTGVRPGSPASSDYYPMNKKGAILLGNGGDNGNGSAGTFYEGVMTTGYPSEAVTDAVQANIVAARYDIQRVDLSRVTTFTPVSKQDVTATLNNTTGSPIKGAKLSISVPSGWTAVVSGTAETSKAFAEPIQPGMTVSAVFTVTSSASTGAGFLTGRAEWTNQATGQTQIETIAKKVRNAFPVKINEVRFSAGSSSTNQFIELYNAGSSEVDLSNWTLMNTQSQWPSIKAATIPAGTKLAGRAFYLLGLSASGLAAPANPGEKVVHVLSTAGFEAGQKMDIDGEVRSITDVGKAASAMTTLFIPVSTGPWLTIPAGSTTIPVTSISGFEVGHKVGIDIGGEVELATVTAVGKQATQTTLSAAVAAGAVNIKVEACSEMTAGDTLTIGTGSRKELVKIKSVGSSGKNGTGIELVLPLKFDQMSGVDVSDAGTGITFTPATKFAHRSGDAVQALGSGITLDSPLTRSHAYGAAIVSTQGSTLGYQGLPLPNQWFGLPLSTAGSLVLLDAGGTAVVDAMVFGTQQSSSSANGTITSPEIAVLEGDQSQGGCIVVAPVSGRGGFGRRGTMPGGEANKSVGRFPDGADTDNNCTDFLVQTATTLAAESIVGADNIKVAGVGDFGVGQTITLDSGANRETAVVASVGTAGAATVSTATSTGATTIPVAGTAGFSVGQTIVIDSGANRETAVIASVSGGRGGFGGRGGAGGGSITVVSPLTIAHSAGVQIAGTGITLTRPLSKAHAIGAQIACGEPTPGASNQYSRKPQ